MSLIGQLPTIVDWTGVREPFQTFYKKTVVNLCASGSKFNYYRNNNSLSSNVLVLLNLETNWISQQSHSLTWGGQDSISIWKK